jgi:hypothetical protein
MMDEIMDRDGHSEGGRAFATAAGSLLNCIYKGLFGIEILAGGMRDVKIVPNLPPTWQDASLRLPTPGGSIDITVRGGITHIAVHDPRVKTIYASATAEVTGAEKKIWHAPSAPPAHEGRPVVPPPLDARSAAWLDEPGFPQAAPIPADTVFPRISCQDLATLDPAQTGAVIIRGNALPFTTTNGQPVQAALEHYLASGGMLIFEGATMKSNQGDARSEIGEHGGVIEWYGRAGNGWSPVDPRTGESQKEPRRDGTVYWGPGHYFGGWDVERGAFGFQVAGTGIQLAAGSPLPRSLAHPQAPVAAAFTDFAVSSPWYFQSLATTHTAFNFLIPARGEDLPCAVRLVNRETHGEILLIARGAETAIDPVCLLKAGFLRK